MICMCLEHSFGIYQHKSLGSNDNSSDNDWATQTENYDFKWFLVVAEHMLFELFLEEVN